MRAYDVFIDRGVTRLCHFTKFQKLANILSNDFGVLPSNSIRSDIKDVIDQQRYDGELEYICCSIEFPNSWFLKNAQERNTDPIFKDWIVLYIDLSILNKKDAKFCYCNASRDRGRHIFTDPKDINKLFASKTPIGRDRSESMLICCPTDDQAEVLIKDNISRDYLIGIAVGDSDVAERVSAMFKICNISNMPIYLSKDVLGTKWSTKVRNGLRPEETEFVF